MKNTAINWNLIKRLPEDGIIYEGGPDYGCFRVAHLPATRKQAELLLAESGHGLYRRTRIFPPNAPKGWSAVQFIAGSISEFAEVK